MQTFFNPTTPFFDDEGRPLVGAMVSFLDLETSASLLPLTDSEGVDLPNPLYTGSDGRIRLDNGNGAPAVPCIADGLSYKVTVARRTGVEPVYIGGILQNGAELFKDPFIAFVVTDMGGVDRESPNTTVLGSIAEVRLSDKGLGSVVCTGYYSAGDCPQRVFNWVESVNLPADNAVNILRNPDDATGYWKMSDPEGGLWDIRIAGCSTSKTPEVNDQCLTRLVNVVSNSGIATIYFPAGNWLLDSGYSFGSLCLEKGANLKPADNTADRTVAVNHLDNRGGRFFAYDTSSTSSKRVIPKVTGVLRISWLIGSLNEFLTANALENVDEIIVDDSVEYEGDTSVTLSNKVVRILDGFTLNSNVTFSDCLVLYSSNGKMRASSFAIDGVRSGVLLDISGLSISDSSHSVVVNHSGMTAENSDNETEMQIDSSAVEFSVSGYTGMLGSAKARFDYSNGNYSELTSVSLKIHNNVSVSNIEISPSGISSSKAILIEMGAYLPWLKVTIDSHSPDIDDTMFGDYEKIIVVADIDIMGFFSVLRATPTAGRVIKFIGLSQYAEPTVHLTDANNNVYACIHSGGSFYLVADGSSWAIDFRRI